MTHARLDDGWSIPVPAETMRSADDVIEAGRQGHTIESLLRRDRRRTHRSEPGSRDERLHHRTAAPRRKNAEIVTLRLRCELNPT